MIQYSKVAVHCHFKQKVSKGKGSPNTICLHMVG